MKKSKILDGLVCVVCIAFCLLVAWSGGRELSWDQFHYHLYAPHAYLNGLLAKDFMAANVSGYLNPSVYIPFYLMVKSGWQSLAIGMAMAIFQALALLFLWHICRNLWGLAARHTYRHYFFAFGGLALGAASPIYMAQLGTGNADISTAVFVVAGVALLLSGVARLDKLNLFTFFGGMCLGAAVWLKMSNVPFALAACIFAFLPGMTLVRRFGYLLRLAGGGIVGGLLATGHWCLTLYHEFGNPLFPMFSGYSRVAKGYSAPILHQRFMPESFMETLLLPFRMALPEPYVYAEVKMPDLRFAAFFVLLVVLLMVKLWEWRRQRSPSVEMPAIQSLYIAYVLCCWMIWACLFANGRYLLPLTLLIGPAITVLLVRILPRERVVLYAALCVGILLFGQAAQWRYGADKRFGEAEHGWPDAWIELDIPANLKQEPHLSLSLDLLSNSFLALYYHSDSRFSAVNGTLALDLEHPGKERLSKLLDAYRDHTRVIFDDRFPAGMPKIIRRRVFDNMDMDLNRFGLQVIRSDCQTIQILSRPLRHIKITNLGKQVQARAAVRPAEKVRHARIFSCATKHASIDPVWAAERQHAAEVLNVVERTCPQFFPPTNSVVLRNGTDWARYYTPTDFWLRVDDQYVRVGHNRRKSLFLGGKNDILTGRLRVNCSLIHK